MADHSGYIKSGCLVAAGGAIGASLRHLTNTITVNLAGDYSLFLATAIENMTGSFFIGLIFSLLVTKSEYNQKLNLFLLTGVIGSYTTYSGFMTDALVLIQESELLFLTYFFGQIIMGLVAVWTGIALASKIKKSASF
ncbi:MAG: CrcB family protein [Balneolaceae bacterium]|nr:CrcB family protein [Balneolaceae bacterium]